MYSWPGSRPSMSTGRGLGAADHLMSAMISLKLPAEPGVPPVKVGAGRLQPSMEWVELEVTVTPSEVTTPSVVTAAPRPARSVKKVTPFTSESLLPKMLTAMTTLPGSSSGSPETKRSSGPKYSIAKKSPFSGRVGSVGWESLAS